MFEGVKEGGKIDLEFEYGWYMESIDLHCEGLETKAREVLRGLFCGVLRMVTGYKWLEDCPENIDLTGINVTAVAQQSENGKNRNEILGSWDIIYSFEACEDKAAKVTTSATLFSIERSMERFVRGRYDLREPEDLRRILLEQQRNDLIMKHFTGIV